MKVAKAALPVRGSPIVYTVRSSKTEENCAAASAAREPPRLNKVVSMRIQQSVVERREIYL